MNEIKENCAKKECEDIGIQEIWRDIYGYEGLYQASNLGNVKSLNRIITFITGRKVLYKTKIKVQRYDFWGYKTVSLCRDGEKKLHKVHRLVAKAFILNPNNLPYVNHKDLIKDNNNILNLEWITNEDNIRHAYNTKYRKEGTKQRIHHGEDRAFAKLNNNKVIEIRKLYATGVYSYQQLADIYNVCDTTIRTAVKKLTWKHI